MVVARSARSARSTLVVAWLATTAVLLMACAGGSESPSGEAVSSAADANDADGGSADVEPVTPAVLVSYSDEELIPICLEDPDPAPADDAPGILVDGNGFGYCVGPALFVGVESATAVGAPEGFDPQLGSTVEPIFTEAGIALFNQLAAECFQPAGGPTPCPSRQVAVVVDGVVVSAPGIQASSFARDQIVISGALTEADAESLANAMAVDGLLEIRPVLLPLGPAGPAGIADGDG